MKIKIILIMAFLSCGTLSFMALAQTAGGKISCSVSHDDLVSIFGASAMSAGVGPIFDDPKGQHIAASIVPGVTHFSQDALNNMYQDTLKYSKPLDGVCDMASERVHHDKSIGVSIFKNGANCEISVAADVDQNQSKAESLAKDICNTL